MGIGHYKLLGVLQANWWRGAEKGKKKRKNGNCVSGDSILDVIRRAKQGSQRPASWSPLPPFFSFELASLTSVVGGRCNYVNAGKSKCQILKAASVT